MKINKNAIEVLEEAKEDFFEDFNQNENERKEDCNEDEEFVPTPLKEWVESDEYYYGYAIHFHFKGEREMGWDEASEKENEIGESFTKYAIGEELNNSDIENLNLITSYYYQSDIEVGDDGIDCADDYDEEGNRRKRIQISQYRSPFWH